MNRSTTRAVSSRILPTLTLLAALSACARERAPRVEAWENGAFQPRVVSAYTIAGRRDGAVTTAVATFTLEHGQQLRLELTIAYNPVPALGTGRWNLEGAGSDGGEVRAESLKFLGGQGEGPSLGGRFLLDRDGNPCYRVTLPLRPLS